MNWAAHSISVSCRLMLPVSRFAPNGKPSSATLTAVVSGRRRYAQSIVQSSTRIVPTRQTNQATSHGRTAHGANSGSIHGRVDVRQERPRRVVRVAAVEPDPDARPVRPGIGAAGLAADQHPGQDEREGQAEQDDRDQPASVAQPGHLASQRAAEDTGPPARPAVDDIGQVDDDPPATAGAASNGAQARVRAVRPSRAHSRTRGSIAGRPDRPLATSWAAVRRVSSRRSSQGALEPVTDGTVIIIGGAEDKVRDRVILSRFVALAGGPDATIAVISTASSLGPEAGERYRARLRRARACRRCARSTP